MLTLGQIIRAPKDHVKIGPWKSGKIPASSFPINKQRRLPSGSAWMWRIVEFEALGEDYRLLLRLNSEVSYYSAILGIESGGLLKVVCHHEFHLSHRNWHCHFVRGDVHDTLPGVLRDTSRMRVYEAEPSKANSVDFSIEPADALAIAASRFRFPAPPETPAQGNLL